MAKYRKKSVVIEAVQLRWDTWSEMCVHAGVGKLTDGKPEGKIGPNNAIGLVIPILEGVMTAEENDYIIKGVQGELYPCKPDIFGQTYEEAGMSDYTCFRTGLLALIEKYAVNGTSGIAAPLLAQYVLDAISAFDDAVNPKGGGDE